MKTEKGKYNRRMINARSKANRILDMLSVQDINYNPDNCYAVGDIELIDNLLSEVINQLKVIQLEQI